MIEVSVIIPTYNRKESLRKALESVEAQEGVPFEIWVIDDGSVDGTEAMIRSDFPDVNYHYQHNRGPAAARNRGIERAKAQWIAFLDSDDLWKPGKLKAQMEFLRANPHFSACQTEEIWIRKGERVNPMKKHQKYGGWIFEKCLPLCIISPSAVMIHRDVFAQVGLFDETYPACEDYELWLRITPQFPVGLISDPYVVKYGGHKDQLSHAFEAMDQFRIRAMSNVLQSHLLNPTQKAAAVKNLKEKSQIFIQGAWKRGKVDEASRIEKMVQATIQKIERTRLAPS